MHFASSRRTVTGAGIAALIALTPVLAACNGEDSVPSYSNTSETSSQTSPAPTSSGGEHEGHG